MAKRHGPQPPSAERQPPAAAKRSSVSPVAASAPASQMVRPIAPPSGEAVALFQRGMEAMQRHAYTEAIRGFQGVLMGFPFERALAERAKLYLGLCERELNRRPVAPKTVEERLTAATAALNNGDDSGAEELARSVLGDDPRRDLALYLLAAIHARRGAHEEALSLLGKVLAITPEASAQARADADFSGLHDLKAFRALTEPPPSAAPPVGPRGRRLRRER